MNRATLTGRRTGAANTLGALAWALAVDLLGTAAFTVTAVWSVFSADPRAAYHVGLAVVAIAGAGLAVVAVALSVAALVRDVPSQRALRVSLVLVILGLVANTSGAVAVGAWTPQGHPGLAVLLLFAGDALSIVYVVLIRRALAQPL